MKVDFLDVHSAKREEMDVSDQIFGLVPRMDIIHRMVQFQLAKRQAGTHKTKTRKEISLTGRKFLRQKGSGGARHGSKKVPQFRGGGKAFGPVVRSHAIALPKKVRALAMMHTLSLYAKKEKLSVVDDLALPSPKVSSLFQEMPFFQDKAKVETDVPRKRGVLIVGGDAPDKNMLFATRNLRYVHYIPYAAMNVYDLLAYDELLLTKQAVAQIEERFQHA